MNNSNQESTSFIYKKILSQLNPLNDTFLSFHPCGTIGSQLWNDRITQVEWSFHVGETIKFQA